ncbi:hypothetical protein B0H10DRAFT_1204979 [Mycena sp. CBHHK59/15]|nr:hypothetical protein B0H10DRAFT_1204979 [Mycena sp. CBHHK59/15]
MLSNLIQQQCLCDFFPHWPNFNRQVRATEANFYTSFVRGDSRMVDETIVNSAAGILHLSCCTLNEGSSSLRFGRWRLHPPLQAPLLRPAWRAAQIPLVTSMIRPVVYPVAGAIVVRSMIIRRRQRERINQAVANGTYMSPSHRGRVDINAKPSMYEVCLDFKDTETDEKSWNGTQPCSAAYTIIPSPSVCDLPKSPHRDSSAPSVSPRRRHFLNPFRSSASPMPPTETAIPMTVTPPRPTSSPRLQARLIFMISMPSPIQPLPTDDRLVLPGLEFGLADVDVLLCSERIEDALLEIKGPGHSNDKDGSDMPPSP